MTEPLLVTPPADPAAWTGQARVWLERAGQAVIGPGRLELLEAIDRLHSISAAARRMRMSYRRAWTSVRDMNEAAGEPLVTCRPGGQDGGGADLTPLGRWVVAAYRHLGDAFRPRPVPESIPATGPAIRIAAAVSLESALGQLLADFLTRYPGASARTLFGSSGELADRILDGMGVDLFLSADPAPLDRLERAGLVRPGKRQPFAGNTLAVIASERSATRLAGPAALTRLVGRPVALAEPGCPLGAYTRAALEPLALYGPLSQRAVRVDNAHAVIAAVRSGHADAGFAYGSDACTADGVQVLFRFRRLARPIRYEAAAIGPDHPDAARFLAFVGSPAAMRRLRQCGFRSPGG